MAWVCQRGAEPRTLGICFRGSALGKGSGSALLPVGDRNVPREEKDGDIPVPLEKRDGHTGTGKSPLREAAPPPASSRETIVHPVTLSPSTTAFSW